ncbi:MAG: CotH kinase family protein [Bacteroidetes bacterium]|nr:CotH kinase family protein [Bacteroidota bacterium]
MANGNGNLYPVGSFEYFNLSKIRTATTYGQFNKHGQDSWALSQRSLDFIARDEMGYNHSVEEKLFTNTARTNFQKIILRAAGDDNFPADYNSSNLGSAHVRDAFIHNLADKGGLSLDVRRGAKCIIYLNGAYWGVYDLRENPDDHDFTDFNYGQDKFNLQYIERWGSIWSEYGGAQAQTDWNTLYDYIMNNDMSVAANYQYVTDRYEVKSLVDYFLVNMFTVCSDWLIWNTAWWRGLDSTGTHLKWGYILWDNDATFGHYINYTGIPNTNPDADPCDPETGIADSEDPDDHIGVLLKLKTNPVFYQYYISRQIDLWNTVFGCDNMLAQLDSTVALIQPEMQQHSTRWSGIYSDWVDNVQTLRDFIVDRCSLLTYGFISCYALNGPYDLTLNTTPAGAGNLRLNSLLLDSFPWTGTYFGGIETLLEAIPNSGYQFNDWNAANHTFTPNATSLNVKITSLNSDDIVIADFNQIVKTNDYPMKAQTVNVYPTIFNDEIIVVYNVLAPAPVTIKLLSPLGQEIITTTPPQSFSDKGYYSVKFNLAGTGLSPGIYLIEFTEGDYRKSVKVVKAGK